MSPVERTTLAASHCIKTHTGYRITESNHNAQKGARGEKESGGAQRMHARFEAPITLSIEPVDAKVRMPRAVVAAERGTTGFPRAEAAPPSSSSSSSDSSARATRHARASCVCWMSTSLVWALRQNELAVLRDANLFHLGHFVEVVVVARVQSADHVNSSLAGSPCCSRRRPALCVRREQIRRGN